MRWFKCIDPQSEAVLSTVEAVGKGGAFECICVVSEAIGQDVHSLRVETVSKWASVKRDRAEKLLPFAKKILEETLKIYRKSSKNLPEISENLVEISENLVDFDASNPHGSTRARGQLKEKDKEKDKETPNPLPGGSDAFEKFWAEYPRKTAKKTAKEAWGRKKLNSQLDEILVGVKAHVATEQWKRGVVPHASTFINQERWKDQLVLPGILTAPTVNTERSRYTSYEELYPEEFAT